MARPTKKTDDQRAAVVSFRLTAAEATAFTKRAQAAGLKPGDYARRVALAGRVTVRKTADADPAVIVQLIKIGTNLNQLARTANGVGRVPPDLDRLCRSIEAAVMKAVEPRVA